MVKRRTFPLVVLFFSLILPVSAQHKVDLRNTYERILAVVPMIGAGTPDDPRRPLYAPLPGKTSRDGIIAFTYQVSDDGKSALLELVARDRAVFEEILNDQHVRSDVKFFQKGKVRKDDVQTEFRKHKRDFDLDNFGVSVQ